MEPTEQKITEIIKRYLQTGGFTDRKLTDTPTDDYQVVNRKYVNSHGLLAARPTAVTGQRYFATDTGIPMVYDGSSWRNGVGSIVAGT